MHILQESSFVRIMKICWPRIVGVLITIAVFTVMILGPQIKDHKLNTIVFYMSATAMIVLAFLVFLYLVIKERHE